MKLEGLDHPKTLDLASRLHVEIPTAIGYLELLWAFAGKKTPQGNVGKWPDGSIAVACFWRGDPVEFVESLVAARLLDTHPEHRLLVHDWAEHAPNWVKAKVTKAKLELFATPRVSAGVSGRVSAGVSGGVPTTVHPHTATDARTDTPTDTATDTASSRARVLPSEAKGSVLRTQGTPGLTPGPDPDQEAYEAELQRVYPKVGGRGPNWMTALHYARQLVEAGRATWSELIAAARRYAAYCLAPGMEWYTVMSPVGFFSAVDEPWAQPWTPPAGKPDAKAMRLAAEAAELEQLKARRADMGIPEFRDPDQHDTPVTYETAMRQFANDKRDRRSSTRSDAPRSAASLLANRKPA